MRAREELEWPAGPPRRPPPAPFHRLLNPHGKRGCLQLSSWWHVGAWSGCQEPRVQSCSRAGHRSPGTLRAQREICQYRYFLGILKPSPLCPRGRALSSSLCEDPAQSKCDSLPLTPAVQLLTCPSPWHGRGPWTEGPRQPQWLSVASQLLSCGPRPRPPPPCSAVGRGPSSTSE